MTDYKTIRGKKIKFFTSDLSSAEAEGQIYYVNTSPGSVDTAGSFKTAVASAAWSASGPLLTARSDLGPATAGTIPASLAFGGVPYTTSTEEFQKSISNLDASLNESMDNITDNTMNNMNIII